MQQMSLKCFYRLVFMSKSDNYIMYNIKTKKRQFRDCPSLRKRKIMKNTIFSVVAVFSMAGAAFAEDAATVPSPVISGEVSLNFTQDANDDWGGAMGLDLGVNASGLATVDLDFEAVDGGAVTLENWTVGTEVGGVGVAMGDDNGVFVGAEGEQTLAAPAMAESVKVTVGDAAVAVGFTDWSSDITDISNIQGAYTIGDLGGLAVTASGDYNMDSENIVLGAAASGLELGVASVGGTVTYDVDGEKFAFEGVANVMGITAYANGDQDDAFQNVGGEYTLNLGGAELTAGGVYNMDSEELTPSVGVSFNF